MIKHGCKEDEQIVCYKFVHVRVDWVDSLDLVFLKHIAY